MCSLNLIFGVKDAHAYLIICRWCRRLSCLFLDHCRNYWIFRILFLRCRGGRVIAYWAHRTFETEIVGGASSSFFSRCWRWSGERCYWGRSNRRSIWCVEGCRSISGTFASCLWLFRFTRCHRLWNIANSRWDSRGRVWLGRALTNFDFPTELIFELFGVLRNLFLRGFPIGERTSFCILPKVCVAFSASAKFGDVTISYANFGYSRFFNNCSSIRCSYDCTTRCQSFP